MRSIVASLALLSAFGLRVCSSSDAPPPAASPPTTVAVSGNAAVAVAAPPPAVAVARHGGSVVVAGGYGVEVLPHADGQVYAYVADPQGGVPAPASVSITVNVRGADTEVHPVMLAWDATDLRYEGRLVGIAPAPGPVEVVLVAEGRPLTGRVEVVPVLAAVDVHVGAPGAVVVGRPAGVVVVEQPAAGVVIAGPRARAVVQAPSLDVHIGGGFAVGGGVIVGGGGRTVVVDDRPRNVILVGPHDNGLHRGHVRVRGRGRGHGDEHEHEHEHD